MKLRSTSAPRSWSHKKYSCFEFPAHSMFTFDVFWGSLGTSTFGNSSSATNNTRSRLPFSLFYPFLWQWLNKETSVGWLEICVANVSFSAKPQLEDTMSIDWISFGKSANWFNMLSLCVKTGTFSAKICKACLG